MFMNVTKTIIFTDKLAYDLKPTSKLVLKIYVGSYPQPIYGLRNEYSVRDNQEKLLLKKYPANLVE